MANKGLVMISTTKVAFVFFLGFMTIDGCRRQDPVVEMLEHSKSIVIDADNALAEERLESAVAKWRNGTLDREPVLILVVLSDRLYRDSLCLWLYTYDEQKDIVGLVIEEQYIDANGLVGMLVEDYPCLSRCPDSEVVNNHPIPVRMRDRGQVKDEKLWGEYVKGYPEPHAKGDPWLSHLPPIWISVPEPNLTSVRVCL